VVSTMIAVHSVLPSSLASMTPDHHAAVGAWG